MDKKKKETKINGVSITKFYLATKLSGLHQYEPVATEENTTEDGEIKITDKTKWQPICLPKSKNLNNQFLLTTQELEAVRHTFYRHLEMYSLAEKFYRDDDENKPAIEKPTECVECLVVCFYERLDALDYMTITELFAEADENEDADRPDYNPDDDECGYPDTNEEGW